jgi:hypothetical protein
MQFNTGKCKIMHIGRNNNKYTYCMDGKALGEVEEEMDVGVVVTNTLKPRRQCEEAARRATTALYQICRAFHYRDRHVFKQLYTSYVRPHLEYCSPAWSPWTAQDMDLLEKVQKKAVNQISGLHSTEYADKLEELGLESLRDRRLRTDMIQTYKIVKGKDDVDRDLWFRTCQDNSSRQTRLSNYRDNLVRTKISRTELRNNFFSQRVIGPWNDLPDTVKESTTVECFKSNYDSYKQRPIQELPIDINQ